MFVLTDVALLATGVVILPISAAPKLPKTMGKLNLPTVAPFVAVLKRFLDIHGCDICDVNYNAATERTDKMLAEYDANTDVKTAAEGLNNLIDYCKTQLKARNTRRNKGEEVTWLINGKCRYD